MENLDNYTEIDFRKIHDRVSEEGKWLDRKPYRYTKHITAWSRKEILLKLWDQFLCYDEEVAMTLGLKPWETLGNQRRIDIVENFSEFLSGAIEAMKEEAMKEDE